MFLFLRFSSSLSFPFFFLFTTEVVTKSATPFPPTLIYQNVIIKIDLNGNKKHKNPSFSNLADICFHFLVSLLPLFSGRMKRERGGGIPRRVSEAVTNPCLIRDTTSSHPPQNPSQISHKSVDSPQPWKQRITLIKKKQSKCRYELVAKAHFSERTSDLSSETQAPLHSLVARSRLRGNFKQEQVMLRLISRSLVT